MKPAPPKTRRSRLGDLTTVNNDGTKSLPTGQLVTFSSGTERALMSADVYTALSAYAALQDIRQAELEDDDNASRHVLRF
jgi:hypothetical protein